MRGKTLVMGVLGAIVGVFVYLALRGGANEGDVEDEGTVPTRTERPAGGRVSDERVAKARAGRPATERQKVLEELKGRWEVLKPRGNAAIKEQDALAAESAKLLLCSEEAVTLMAWLDSNELRYGAVKIRYDLERRLKSPDAGDLREMLTRLPALPPESGKAGHHLVQYLCNAAGQGCSVEEFEAFHLGLQSDSYAMEATLGRNRVLMRSDPKAGILSTMELWDTDVHSLSKWDHLNRQLREDFPEGVDFAELEGLLPVSDDHWKGSSIGRGPVVAARQNILGKWAKADLDSAARYVMENPERLEVELLKTVAGAAKFKSPEEAVAWVDGFEEGPYFDQAVMGALFYLNNYDRVAAVALAERIGDPELRKQGVKRAGSEIRHDGGG